MFADATAWDRCVHQSRHVRAREKASDHAPTWVELRDG
jgi:hypothetical protein